VGLQGHGVLIVLSVSEDLFKIFDEKEVHVKKEVSGVTCTVLMVCAT
jgi:hypothetical protein